MRGLLGLRSRLILPLLAAFAALTCLVVWQSIEHRNHQLSDASAKLLANARLIAARQQQIVARADAILTGLMLRPELQPGANTEACAQFLAARLIQAPEFIQAGRVRPDGDIACAAMPAANGVNVADRSWFQQALTSHDMVVSDVLTGRIIKQPTIIFAKSVRNKVGRVTGVLYLSLDLTWLHHELTEAKLPEGTLLTVVDAGGDIAVHHPELNDLHGKNIADQPLFRHVAAAPEGIFEETGLDGIRRLYGFTPLLETASGRLTLWLSLPKAMVAAPVERELWRNLSFALGVLVITLGPLMLVGNRMVVRPLMVMMRKTERFRAGDHAVRTGLPHTGDDIGQLARMLDETAEAVQDGEHKLVIANRALRVLSAGNRTMLRSKSEQDLLEQMCHAIVAAGDYRLAWIGFAEADKRVRLVASAGTPADFIDNLDITWDEFASGQGPTGRAIREGVPVAINDALTDPAYAPWRERARQAGYVSSLALPLRIGEKVIGALTLCAVEQGAFDADVVALLRESADDLAFGIATRRADVELDRTQETLRVVEDRFRQVAAASLDALFILGSLRDAQGEIVDFEFIDVNPNGEALLGRSRDEIIGRKLCELIPINRTGGFFDKYVAVVKTDTPLEEEFPIDTPDIHAKWLRHQVVKVGDGIAISSRDITIWKEAAAEIRRQDKLRWQILDAAGEGIFGLDLEGRATFVNPAAAAMLQWDAAETVGQPTHALHHHTRADGTPYPREECPIYAAYRDGKARRVTDEVFWRQDGTSFPVEYVSTPTYDENDKLTGAVVGFEDISERKANEMKLARAVRALNTLSAGNEALVRATSEEELLQSVTDNIVEQGGYRLARVSYAEDNPEKTLRRVASAGVGEDFIPQEQLTLADVEGPQATIAHVIRSGRPRLCRDIAGDPAFAPWKDAALAQGYASNIGLPLCDDTRCFGGLSIYSAEKDAFDDEEARLLTELANDLAYGIVTLRTRAERDRIVYAHAHHAEILQKSLEQSIQAIADTVEARDPYTAGHQRRVGELAAAIAREMGLPEETIHGIHLAATIHDLGKIHIPAEILSKPGKLSDIEFMLIKAHPQAGYDILKDIEFPWPIADIVRQHHEKLDGSGYPQGLKDGEIRLESRIMTVADVVEAMSSHRPYRAALGIEVALKEIERGRGGAYDAAVADACLKLFREGRFAFQG